MALIKSIGSQRFLKDAIVLDIGDLNRQADRILGDARAEAERILGSARAEAARLTEGAEDRGYAQGLEKGIAEGRATGL